MALGLCRFTNVLGGTADFEYPGPTTDMQSPASAGAVNGTTYKYYAQSFDMSEWEIGTGAYSSGTGTFARTSVDANSLGTTALIDFSNPPQVIVFDTYPATDLSSYATIASPTFTGDPKAPTPTPGDNDTSIATTAFVTAAIAAASAFASGTLMLFQQTSAPTGWTKQATHNDKALRVVSGTASSGGTNAFSTVMAQTTVGSTTLSTSTIPAHTHTYTAPDAVQLLGFPGNPANAVPSASSSSTGNGGLGGGSHNHSITMSIQYVDVIIASKN